MYEQRKEIAKKHASPDEEFIASLIADGCNFKEAERIEQLQRRENLLAELKAEGLATVEEVIEAKRVDARLTLLHRTTPSQEGAEEETRWECPCGWSAGADPNPVRVVGVARCPRCDSYSAQPVE